MTSAFALSDAVRFANIRRATAADRRALCEGITHRIQIVLDYRNGLIQKRDHKAAQIPLRPSEERMWATKIALADETIAELRAELAAQEREIPSGY